MASISNIVASGVTTLIIVLVCALCGILVSPQIPLWLESYNMIPLMFDSGWALELGSIIPILFNTGLIIIAVSTVIWFIMNAFREEYDSSGFGDI